MRQAPLSTTEAYRIGELFRDERRGVLRLDHPLQRAAKNWDNVKKGNFMRRILQGGKFLPLQICTQIDKNGCEIRYLIDGKQRMTTIQEYVNNEFAIPKRGILDYEVTYDGILYAVNENSEWFKFRTKNGNLIPILDDEGNKQRVQQTIDIRGLRFRDLPPELQEVITEYMIPVQIKHGCTDADIQLEIIDYNSGAPMNVAQLGKARLNIKIADSITKLSQHDMITSKCGFSATNEIKGVIERSVGEALALTMLGVDKWKDNYKELCFDMGNYISDEDINALTELFDKFEEGVSETDELRSHMVNKEFFIVIANFAYFIEKGYPVECYNGFIQQFVSKLKYDKIINTGDIDENGEEIYDNYISVYEKGTKKADSIKSRLNQMNVWLDKYLEENYADIQPCVDEQDCDATEFNLEGASDELQEFAQNFTSDEAAIQTLMLVSNCPYANFNINTLNATVDWFGKNGDKELLNNCLFYKEYVKDAGIDDNDPNLPLYIYGVKYIDTNGNDVNIDEWLAQFKERAFIEIDNNQENNFNDNSTIALKQSEIIQNIKNFYIKEIEEAC